MKNPAIISIIPLIFIRISEYLANLPVFFSVDVNSAKTIIIMHCPSAKENNNEIEKIILVDIVATAIMLANIGDEQGLDARAKKVPIKNGNKKMLPDLFWGIFFIIAGNCISMIPSKFNPIITITDANSNITIGDAKLVNALPVKAQITPIMLNTNESPSENDSICINNFLLFSFE